MRSEVRRDAVPSPPNGAMLPRSLSASRCAQPCFANGIAFDLQRPKAASF